MQTSPTRGEGSQPTSQSSSYLAEAIRQLGEGPGSTHMKSKMPPGTKGERGYALVTNAYGLQVDMGSEAVVYRYQLLISGVRSSGGAETAVDFTLGGNTPTILERREASRLVFLGLVQREPQLFADCHVYFDLHETLFADKELMIPQTGIMDTFETDGFRAQYQPADPAPERQPSRDPFLRFNKVRILLKPILNEQHNTVSIRIAELYRPTTAKLELYDPSLQQFMEILIRDRVMHSPTTHMAISQSNIFLKDPLSVGLHPEEIPDFEYDDQRHDGKGQMPAYLAIGPNMSVRFIEGVQGVGFACMSVIISPKKTVMYKAKTVEEIARFFVPNLEALSNGDVFLLNNQLKGLFFMTTHRDGRVMKISGISADTPKQTKFTIVNGDARETNAFDYFREKYPQLSHCKDLPMVEVKKGNNVENFPMELCRICPGQRVRLEKMSTEMARQVLELNASLPFDRQAQGHKVMRSLQLTDNQGFLRDDVRFIPEPLIVPNARVLAPPALVYGNHQVVRPNLLKACSWSEGNVYLKPAAIENWSIMAFLENMERLDQNQLNDFVRLLRNVADRKGMVMPPPVETPIFAYNREKFKAEMGRCVKAGRHLVFVVHGERNNEIHAAMKLLERELLVVTQGVLLPTVAKCIRPGSSDMVTVTNIINKTNMKMKGVNYSINVNNPSGQALHTSDKLIIGVSAVFKPPPRQIQKKHGSVGSVKVNGDRVVDTSLGEHGEVGTIPPAVVGFSANCAADPYHFVGDFMVQGMVTSSPRMMKPKMVFRVVECCLRNFIENRQRKPKELIVYRGGLNAYSAEEFKEVLKWEVAHIKVALKKADASDCKVTVIAVDKHGHSIRFFPVPQARDLPSAPDSDAKQTLLPGTVVDRHIVAPQWSSFLLSPHNAIKGTAVPTMYTILTNEANYSMDAIQGITNDLAYAHQICSSPTSLPTPAYLAKLFAERGHSLLMEWWWRDAASDNSRIEVDDLDRWLAYRHCVFANRRINA